MGLELRFQIWRDEPQIGQKQAMWYDLTLFDVEGDFFGKLEQGYLILSVSDVFHCTAWSATEYLADEQNRDKGNSCWKGMQRYQVELAQVEAEIEKLLDTLTGANATLLAYANKKIEDLDNRRKTLSKAIADLSVETLSSQQIELLSGYLDDWENISFEDKRKAADGLISSISATSDYVKIEWKI